MTPGMPRKPRDKSTGDDLTSERIARAALHLLQLAVEFSAGHPAPTPGQSYEARARTIYREAWPVLNTADALAGVVDALLRHRDKRASLQQDVRATYLISWTRRVVRRFGRARLSRDRRARVVRLLQLKFMLHGVPLSADNAEVLLRAGNVVDGGGTLGIERRVRQALSRILGGYSEDYLRDLKVAMLEGEAPDNARVKTRAQAFALDGVEENPPGGTTAILRYVLPLLVATIRENAGEQVANALVRMLVDIWAFEQADLLGLEVTYTIGYRGRALADFILVLERAGVTRVVDVRARAGTRKGGFSKTPLRAALAARSIDYIHIPGAGNPYKDEPGGIQKWGKLYAAHLDANPEVLLDVEDALDGRRVALLCGCRNAGACHRSILTDQLLALDPGRVVHHL